jgi:hypothetical protein
LATAPSQTASAEIPIHAAPSMKPPLPTLLLFSLLAAGSGAFAKDRDETLILSQDHSITITVPDGYVFSSGREESGMIMAKITDPKEKVQLQVSFRPDPESRLGVEQQQMDFLAQVCKQYAEGSVEHSYDFKPLAPRRGAGTYCVFTDASLVGSAPPKGEFLNVTTGVKAWPGWAIVFTLLSNDVTSKEYQTALRLVKESFEENPPATAPKH